jgi:hypothetical protein
MRNILFRPSKFFAKKAKTFFAQAGMYELRHELGRWNKVARSDFF